MRVLVTVLMLVLACAAQAENSGVLVQQVPKGASQAAVMAAVRQALVGRHWTIESSDATAVTAAHAHNETSARIHIALDGASLVYRETTTRKMNVSRAPNGGFSARHQPVKLGPWLENLRHDVSMLLAGIPLEATN